MGVEGRFAAPRPGTAKEGQPLHILVFEASTLDWL